MSVGISEWSSFWDEVREREFTWWKEGEVKSFVHSFIHVIENDESVWRIAKGGRRRRRRRRVEWTESARILFLRL